MANQFEVLVPFRLNGTHCAVGDVLSESDFNSRDEWANLVNMPTPRLAVSDAKGKPSSGGKKALPEV